MGLTEPLPPSKHYSLHPVEITDFHRRVIVGRSLVPGVRMLVFIDLRRLWFLP